MAVESINPAPAVSTPLGRRLRAALGRVSSPEWLKGAIYSIYAHRLEERVIARPMPLHIGVVLDGNRRYARLNRLSDPSAGHRLGTRKVDDFLVWCDQMEVPVVTLWTLSVDNLRRDPAELRQLIEIVEERLPHLRDLQRRVRHPRKIRVCGRTELLPVSMREAIARVERDTDEHGPFVLNIAMGYGGREEIVDAVKRLLLEEDDKGRSPKEVADGLTPQAIGERLYFKHVPEPDLIIRTSGEQRLSGFLLWESVYSEYYFCDVLWPAFRKIDFLRAIRSYQDRKRRFGH